MGESRGALWRSRWAAIGAAVAVSLGAGGVVIAQAASSGASTFVPVTPCRLLDTRAGAGIGGRSTPLGPQETITVRVRGTNGQCVIPSDATGVAANVTTTDGTATSFLTIFPADVTQPNASSNNWVDGTPATPNKVDAKLSADGAINVYNDDGTVNVLIDVVGYYEPSGSGGGVSGLSGYQTVAKTSVNVPPQSIVSDFINCPAGKVPVGGAAQSFATLGTVQVLQSTVLSNGWAFDLQNNGLVGATFFMVVVCINS